MNKRLNFVGLGLLSLVSFAEAQYSVGLEAWGWSKADYHYSTFVGGHIDYASYGSPVCTVTPDQTGTATSSYATVFGHSDGNIPHDANTYNQIAVSNDLGSVTQTFSEYDTGHDTGADGGSTANLMSDVLTFNVTGGNSSSMTTIGYTRVISGHLQLSGSNGDPTGLMQSQWGLSGGIGAGGNVKVALDPAHGTTAYMNGVTGDGSFTTISPTLIVQTGTFTFHGASLTENFFSQVNSGAVNGMDENYTSTFHLDLPTGVTLKSSSGVFQAVPEPTSALALSGLSLLMIRRRRAK